jgi:hypothetical protein
MAYNEFDKHLYVVETFSKSGLIFSEVAEIIQTLDKKYKFAAMVVDNAGKQGVEEIRKRYQLPLLAADKSSKREFIELLNSDLLTSVIKLTPGAQDLKTEWDVLVWDETKKEQGKYVEHPSMPNHLSDAFLYGWRWCASYASMPRVVIPIKGSEQEVDAWWEEQQEKIDNPTDEDLWYGDGVTTRY